MEDNYQTVISYLEEFYRFVLRYASPEWFLYQMLIMVGCYVGARLIGAAVEGRLESWARSIKGHPGVLRVIIALMRRVDWLIFALLLFVSLTILRGLTWSSRSYLISIVRFRIIRDETDTTIQASTSDNTIDIR